MWKFRKIVTIGVRWLLWPLTRLGETLDQYQRAMASTNRVMDLLDTPVASPPGYRALPTSQVRGEILLKDVTFAYRDRPPVVEHLSLEIPAGKTIAIVGSTGSGKSTLVKLLLRLYEIQAGSITLDGIDLRELQLRDLRQSIGLVSQDVFLFHGSVWDNITYGTPHAAPAEVIAAAKIAEAHEFIEQLPQGYETIVGERGQKLSGGQRQRLAIARAVLKNPPILILDEATSAVDNETEAAIQRSLEKITQNRTTVAIAPGERVRCEISRWADSEAVNIQVQNYGTPIPEAILPKLTQPFCSTKPNGTGLGLAIVKRIVSDHGGELRIQSVAATGTTVDVQLPIAKP